MRRPKRRELARSGGAEERKPVRDEAHEFERGRAVEQSQCVLVRLEERADGGERVSGQRVARDLALHASMQI